MSARCTLFWGNIGRINAKPAAVSIRSSNVATDGAWNSHITKSNQNVDSTYIAAPPERWSSNVSLYELVRVHTSFGRHGSEFGMPPMQLETASHIQGELTDQIGRDGMFCGNLRSILYLPVILVDLHSCFACTVAQ